MGLFSRKPKTPGAAASPKDAQAETMTHLRDFIASRPGCEAFIEPPTRVTQTTMVVVAETGEWTRRRIPDQATARKVADKLGIPAYDVNLSGYPSRMREWNETHRKQF
ncbi:oxidoreductase [Demequina sp.]|uniref:oxidoreductase n=1 Tax=Demequina sp. TaxID=2050685 RepID=UPI003D0BFBFC